MLDKLNIFIKHGQGYKKTLHISMWSSATSNHPKSASERHWQNSKDKTQLSSMAAFQKKAFNTKIMLGSSTICAWRKILFIVWLNQVSHLGGDNGFYFSSISPTQKSLLCWTTEPNELTKNRHP